MSATKPNSGTRTKVLFGFILIGFISVAIVRLFDGPEKPTGKPDGHEAVATASPTPLLATPQAKQLATPKPSPKPDDPIAGCLAREKDLASFSSEGEPKEVYTRLFEFLKPETAAQRELVLRNVHVRFPDGGVRRLQEIADDSPNAGQKLKLRFFSVDAEDLPVPEDLPFEIKGLSNDEAIKRFREQGEVLLDEVEETLRWNGNRSARVLRRDGRVTRLELFMGQRALMCDAESPRCVCQTR
jgi:hypothetical protein